MNLPNVEAAQVEREKITGYLLSSTHRDGRGKHDFFVRFGFSPLHWERLAEALVRHASEHEVLAHEPTQFGIRFVIEGPLSSPDGRKPLVRSVWFLDTREGAPRLVTAYPV